MPAMKARIIPESEARSGSILAPLTTPAVKGNGNLDIVCGACGSVLIQHITLSLQFRKAIIRCPQCNQCNDIE
jgi:hypothetical protein